MQLHCVSRWSVYIKHDVVVWGGTRDVSRNETQRALNQIRNFVEKHSQTNILVMSVRHRFDLEAYSCVNSEVKLNRF